MSPARSATVKFNVGGRLYEVSRSLLEQHPPCMLTRMASETWNKEDDDTEAFFIERNGNRFQYVLDYMRDGKVTLPYGEITKVVVLEELLYFGFESVNQDAVQVAFDAFSIPEQITMLDEELDDEVAELKDHKDEVDIQIACKIVAHACAIRRIKSGHRNLVFEIAGESRNVPDRNKSIYELKEEYPETWADYQVVNHFRKAIVWKGQLQQALAKYGLHMETFDTKYDRNQELEKVTIKIAPVSSSVLLG